MTPDETNIPRARRSLRELFDAALALPPEQRNAFIAEQGGDDEQRSRLTRLLANADDAADPEGVLPRLDVAQLVNALAEEAPVLPPDARIGSFELLEVLGEGGSSTVFRAARTVEGVRQEVALKLLRRPLHSPD
ncbi:MAG: hypothetical protein LBE59_10185, partial [Nevskiaceae bacterium]|nr:hypothetical protein [Nevskiaceae bacterium]